MALAHIVLGFINMWQRDFEGAIAEVNMGLELDPNHAEGQMYKAIILGFAGQPEFYICTFTFARLLWQFGEC
jgi:hypothetical protein